MAALETSTKPYPWTEDEIAAATHSYECVNQKELDWRKANDHFLKMLEPRRRFKQRPEPNYSSVVQNRKTREVISGEKAMQYLREIGGGSDL